MNSNLFKMEFVTKPWGFESRNTISNNLALTQLFLNCSQSTSFHCHPIKTTSMVCLSGSGVIQFFNTEFNLKAGKGFTIRNGLFHKIVNSSNREMLQLLEFENPPDKFDLIRFSDNYGRENLPYEEPTIDSSNLRDYIDIKSLINNNECLKVGDLVLRVFQLANAKELNVEPTSQFVVLEGGIVDLKSGYLVLRPADFIGRSTLVKLLSRFKIYKPFKLLEFRQKDLPNVYN